MTTELDRRTDEISLAGNVGFWAVVLTTVVLLIHPFGTTELYGDGQQFLEHVDVLWVTIHFVVALLFMVLLLPINVWARNLSTTTARTWGRLATLVAIAGTAVGLFHLTATDTTTFVAFADTFESEAGSESANLGGDLLLRLHAATFAAWVTSYFFAVPALVAVAAWQDRRFPAWQTMLAVIASVLAAVSVVLTLGEGQLTTLSEVGIFRPSVTLFLIWMLTTTWWMRRGTLGK